MTYPLSGSEAEPLPERDTDAKDGLKPTGKDDDGERVFIYPPKADLVQQRHAPDGTLRAPQVMPGVRPFPNRG